MKTSPHWTADPTRCTTCDYRYEIVLTDSKENMIDGDYAKRRQSAFERGELWLKRNPTMCVAVYDRMARIGAPYQWRLTSPIPGSSWTVTKLKGAA